MVLRMPRLSSHAPASWSFKDPATASQLGLRPLTTREPGVLQVVHRGRDWRARAGARSDYESDSGDEVLRHP